MSEISNKYVEEYNNLHKENAQLLKEVEQLKNCIHESNVRETKLLTEIQQLKSERQEYRNIISKQLKRIRYLSREIARIDDKYCQ